MIDSETLEGLLTAADLEGSAGEELLRFHRGLLDKPGTNLPTIEAIDQNARALLYLNTLSVPADWKPAEDSGPEGWLQNLMTVMTALPAALAEHRSLGVPEQVTRETFGDIGRWTGYFRESRGLTGLSTRITWWFARHLRARLFSLGRLQFFMKPFGGAVLVFRSSEGSTALLARPDMTCRSNGLRTEDDPAFTTRLEITGEGFRGNPVRNGFVQTGPEFFDRNRWRLAVGKYTPMLDMHIPAGGSLSPDACADSIRRAFRFFHEFFPNYPFRGFMCESWFLDPRYREVLSPESNLLKFAGELNLYPTREEREEGFWRVFGEGVTSLAEAPRQTRMQKAVAEYLESGGDLTGGGGIILNQEHPWGVE
jgi:hypothetical protein